MMTYFVLNFLICMLTYMSTLPKTEAAPTTERFSTSTQILSSVFAYLETACKDCCETRRHGYVIVNAEVIESDCPSSSFRPLSSTFTPISSTAYHSTYHSTEGTTEIPSSSGTSELPSSSIESSSSSPSADPSSKSTTTTSTVTTSMTPSSTNSSTSSSVETTKPSSSVEPTVTFSSSRASSRTSTVIPRSSSEGTLSTFFPSSLFPSTGASSTQPDFSCGIGEICCETRVIGHVVVLAEVLGGPDGPTTPLYYSTTTM